MEAESTKATGRFTSPHLSFQHPQPHSDSLALFFVEHVAEYCQVADFQVLGAIIESLTERLKPGAEFDNALDATKALIRAAAALTARFQHVENVGDRRLAALFLREASRAVPNCHGDKILVLDLAATATLQMCSRLEKPPQHETFLAANLLSQVLSLEEGDVTILSQALECLGVIRLTLFRTYGNVSVLDQGILDLHKSLALTPEISGRRMNRLVTLALAKLVRFEGSGRARDIKSASRCVENATSRLTLDRPQDVLELLPTAERYCLHAYQLKDIPMLEKSTVICDHLLGAMTQDHPKRADILFLQGQTYSARFEGTGEVAYLEVAARQLRYALEQTSHSGDAVPKIIWITRLARTSDTWHRLHSMTKRPECLETASSLLEEALQVFVEAYGHSPAPLVRMRAKISFLQCIHFHDAKHVATAMQRVKDVLSDMAQDDDSRPAFEEYLAVLLEVEKGMHQKTHAQAEAVNESHEQSVMRKIMAGRGGEDISTLQSWIQLSEESMQTSPNQELWLRAATAFSVGTSALDLWHQSHKVEDLEQALSLLETAPITSGSVNETAYEDPDHLGLLARAMGAWYRYWLTEPRGHPEANAEVDGQLDAAIQLSEKLLEQKRSVPLLLLYQTGIGYLARWEGNWDKKNEADLDQALTVFKMALGKGSDNSLMRSEVLGGLGVVFCNKFLARMALSDLEEGIRFLEQAVETLPPLPSQNFRQARHLGHLGCASLLLFSRTGDKEALLRAVPMLEKVVDSTSDENLAKAKAKSLEELAIAYTERGYVMEDMADNDRAIACLKQSMEISKQHHRPVAKTWMILSLVYRHRQSISNNEDEWLQEVDCLENMLREMPEDAGRRWMGLECLGKAYKRQFRRTGNHEYLQKATENLQQALSYDKDLGKQIVGKELFEIYASQKDWSQAHDVASAIFSRIHRNVDRSLENTDKLELLREYAGLASDAAAASFLAGKDAYTALRFLETGRGIITSSLLGIRAELDNLRMEHPALAEQYRKARDGFDFVRKAPTTPAAEWLPVNQPTYRHSAASALDEVIESIRRLDGYSSFLKEASEQSMTAAAAGGPIVIINVSRYSCHFIIVKADGITNHALQDIDSQYIERLSRKTSVQALDTEVLEKLWDKIASPVLSVLGITDSPPSDGVWPRLWWIPTGALAKLPLHAAGYHEASTGTTVLDRVISSYSLSIGALVQSRASLVKQMASSGKPKSIVLVGMKDLAHAPQEIEKVADISRGMEVRKMPDTSADKLLRALRDADMFHFAGHGSSDQADPLKSSLLLRADDRLTISTLFELNLHDRMPFLAFLSACSTGKIRQDDALDEGLHLISACQVAGFRHVVGTLWEVDDKFCVSVAEIVYKWIYQQGLSHESVSEGLHHASRRLRDEWNETGGRENTERGVIGNRESMSLGREQRNKRRNIEDGEDGPIYWVPYVHYGI